MAHTTASPSPIRVLCVEDDESDMLIARHRLTSSGLDCVLERVETEQQLRAAIERFAPQVVLSDFKLPQFDGHAALRTVRDVAPEIPFIFVSGTMGEERAIEALLQGAADYVLKQNLNRLVPAVTRALDEAAARLERRRQQQQIERLSRVLRMLSGINSIIVRIRGSTELLEEACRLAVSVGQYSSAMVLLRQTGGEPVQPVAWAGQDEKVTTQLRTSVTQAANQSRSLIAKVLATGKEYVCNAPNDPLATMSISSLMVTAGFKSVIALPLLVEKTVVGLMVLTAGESGAFSEEELQMLREVSANLSFALRYLHKEHTARALAHFDPLTGLPKRALLCERLERFLESRTNEPLAVAVFDVQQLSVINDSFGRHTGDLLLQHIADRLRRYFKESELLAQFGGGSFAVCASGGVSAAESLGQQIDVVFEEPFEIEGRRMPVIVRSGIAVREEGMHASTMIQNAEAALHHARVSAQRLARYSRDSHTQVVARLALEHKLRRALELNQFELYYQPKMGLKTRCIEGAEALIRWHDPETGIVSPADFLPLLESTGLIVDVGDWVLRQAAADSRHWQQAGLATVRVAVNISPQQLASRDFAYRFEKLIEGWVSGRCGLDIEITEGTLLEGAEAEVEMLERLRSSGVRIAIDDFGTGYSSLARLSTLPVDTLKIDRSFVNGLANDRSARTLVETILSMARAFNMDVVAEGVETEQQLNMLDTLGCDQAQGYLMSRPVPRDAFATLLQRGNAPVLKPPDWKTQG